MSRRRHTDLQPLATSKNGQDLGKRRNSSQSSLSLNSAATLPSPTIVAARAYHLEHETPIGPKLNAQQRRRSLFEAHQFPRRHSAVAAEGDLAAQLEGFTFSSPKIKLQTVPETVEALPEIKIEESADIQMTGTKQNDLMKIGKITSRQRSGDLLVTASDVPFLYIHDRLRDWGSVYLGNSATADAFVNAVSLRRPSLAAAKGESRDLQPGSSNLVTIRARVVPRAKERNPFLIQRQFDIEDLRSSIPRSRNRSEGASPPRLRRSSRQRRSSAQQLSSGRRGSIESSPGGKLGPLGKGAVPIHIEYALHYLPVLGALMLSGHVRKGDAIDLPMPRPEAWRDVVSYIYTGKGEVSPAMRQDILFLAGNAD
ncbi:hypothetical protein LSUE1_G007733 [Lachnellula suecica]|uniref:BTB domain-containing protein n=1 Tax=Lachnellula suecica TaxID=602035 RepID=A0A8T9C912_9HELO|nr:hypothetical protein LSUE1_G007733 [Lachnellula suecica]